MVSLPVTKNKVMVCGGGGRGGVWVLFLYQQYIRWVTFSKGGAGQQLEETGWLVTLELFLSTNCISAAVPKL